jgi:hypothetical protein
VGGVPSLREALSARAATRRVRALGPQEWQFSDSHWIATARAVQLAMTKPLICIGNSKQPSLLGHEPRAKPRRYRSETANAE